MATGQRFNPPYYTPVDATGVPLAGAELWFYQSGTSTPLNTYSNAGLTVPNTNPVIADSSGQFGNIFLLPQSYKVIETPSGGSPTDPIFTADPVSGSSLPEIANGTVLGNITGSLASPVGITPSQVLDIIDATQGDLLYRGGTQWLALPAGDVDDFLFTGGPGANPVWRNPFYSTDAGAGQGPVLTLTRASPSPAASDSIGGLSLDGRNSIGTNVTYADVYGEIVDPTNGSEDGRLGFRTIIGGTVNTKFYQGAGFYSTTATGGDQGNGTINVSGGYYINGVSLASQAKYTSPLQTITSGATVTLAHNLGGTPTIVQSFLVNQVSELNYSVGDILQIAPGAVASDEDRGITFVVDATNVVVNFGAAANTFIILDKTAGTRGPATNADWKLRVIAFA